MPQVVLTDYLYQLVQDEKVEEEGFNSFSEAVRHILRKNLESENGGEK